MATEQFTTPTTTAGYLLTAIASVFAGAACLAIVFACDAYGRVRRWPIKQRIRHSNYNGEAERDALYQRFMDRSGSEYEWEKLLEEQL
jgi:hypothetical protein